MRKTISSTLAVGALVTGSLLATAMPAAAKAYCERYTQSPAFTGSTIDAYYYVDCSRTVTAATLYGRLKEDRSGVPDVVLDTESVRFTGDAGDHVTTVSCQDGDLIYSEAQINSESPTASSRREMNC